MFMCCGEFEIVLINNYMGITNHSLARSSSRLPLFNCNGFVFKDDMK